MLEGKAQAEASLHPGRNLGARAIPRFGEPAPAEEFVRPGFDSAQIGSQLDVLRHRKQGVEGKLHAGVADLATDFVRTLAGGKETGQDPPQRGLSRSVGAGDGEYLTSFEADLEPPKKPSGTVALSETGRRKDHGARARRAIASMPTGRASSLKSKYGE